MSKHGCFAGIFLLPITIILACSKSHALQDFDVRVRLKQHQTKIRASVDSMKSLITRSQRGVWIISSSDGNRRVVNEERLILAKHSLEIEGERLPYQAELIATSKAKFDVIAKMDLDSYLSGVLPSEMPLSWPLEALKAQTVAARSYVIKTALERKSWHYDVDSTTQDQVFKFKEKSEIAVAQRIKLNSAISETSGKILLNIGGGILKAFYHADCGCQTEDPKYVWGTTKGFSSVKDPTCKRRKTYRWNTMLSSDSISEKLKDHFALPENSEFEGMKILNHTPSGRVSLIEAKFILANGQNIIRNLSAQIFRKIFGFEKIKSSQFRLSSEESHFYFDGKGMGHGVGLCQWGARAMAEEGSTYLEILKNFYPRAKLAVMKSQVGLRALGTHVAL